MGKRRDAFEAGYEAGTVPKGRRQSVEDAFDAYKASLDLEDGEATAEEDDDDGE